ncbi:MAG TPA: L,D-transpeptidase, partial [Polyangiaceae bacterium]
PSTGFAISRPLGFREALPITGRSRSLAGLSYLETTSGDWLRDDNLVRVDRMVQRPGWVKPGRTWIHVSIMKQSMVAYVGDKPVYATLVSTGADGMGDPKTTHSTVRGEFLIHTKHVTATMDSDEVGDEFDLRDVPYVQYFSEGFAFHAAYWHDTFGTPHSHGCVNLSPIDSRWLFHWTDPPVPQAWHGALSLRGGTLVYISP